MCVGRVEPVFYRRLRQRDSLLGSGGQEAESLLLPRPPSVHQKRKKTQSSSRKRASLPPASLRGSVANGHYLNEEKF